MKLISLIWRAANGIHLRARYFFLKVILGGIGLRSVIYPNVSFTYPENVYIGNNVSIAPGVHIGASSQGIVRIGNRSAIASGVRIVTATHDPSVLPVIRVGINRSVTLGEDVWIGTGAIILPGVTISDGSIVAAGAVVNKDVPSDSMVAGVPAKIIKQLDPRDIRFSRHAYPPV